MAKEKKNEKQKEEVEANNEQTSVSDVEENKTETTSDNKKEDDMKEKFLRLAADFDNFKKRTRVEKDALYGMAVGDTVEKFLPILDDLERAVAAAEDSPMKKGVEQILAKAGAVLSNMGVTPVGEKGEKFDVAIHEAVMQCECGDMEEGCVAEVFQKGYKLGDKVIRYAKVKVTQ